MSLPVNPRNTPTADQLKRAEIADSLFQLHNRINIEISRAVTEIMQGADVNRAVGALLRAIVRAAGETAEQIKH